MSGIRIELLLVEKFGLATYSDTPETSVQKKIKKTN